MLVYNLGFFLLAMWLRWRRLTPLCVGEENGTASVGASVPKPPSVRSYASVIFSLNALCAPSFLYAMQRTASAGTEVAFLVCPKVPVCG